MTLTPPLSAISDTWQHAGKHFTRITEFDPQTRREGVDTWYYLVGPEGVVYFWYTDRTSIGEGPLPGDVGCHWRAPLDRFQPKGHNGCTQVPTGVCYSHRTGITAPQLLRRLTNEGPEAVWIELVTKYEQLCTREWMVRRANR